MLKRQPRRRRWLLLILVVAVIAAGWIAMGSPGWQPRTSAPRPECYDTVIDTTSQHVLSNPGEVRAAAASLEHRGVKVRVRVLEAMPTSGYSSYIAGMASNCPNWLGPTKVMNHSKVAGLDNRMLVVILARGQTAGVAWGNRLGPRIGAALGPALADMNRRFGTGDYSGGLAALLNDLAPAITPAPPVSERPAQPATRPGLSPTVLGGLVVALLVVIAWLVWRSTGKRKLRRKTRRRLRRAYEAVMQCQPDAAGLTSGLPNSRNESLMRAWLKINRRYTATAELFEKLGRHGPSGQYIRVSNEADEIAEDARLFLDHVRRVMAQVRRAALPPPRRAAIPPGEATPLRVAWRGHTGPSPTPPTPAEGNFFGIF